MYRIRMYRSARGEAPVEGYLSGLEEKHRRKILVHLDLLVVLLHSFLKKTNAVPENEIRIAEARMNDLTRRLAAGEELE